MDLTSGPWWVDLSALAAVLVAMGTIWRMLFWPILRALWATMQAIPKIPIYLENIQRILESNVLEKLDEAKVGIIHNTEQLGQQLTRIDSHTIQLESHELRLGKLEKGQTPDA